MTTSRIGHLSSVSVLSKGSSDSPSASTRTEKPSLTEVYHSEIDYVCRFLSRLGVPDRDLDDVAHDIFVVVHRRLHTYDLSRPLRPWITGIAFRVASDYRRKASNYRERLVDKLPDVGQTASGEKHVLTQQAGSIAQEALNQLDEKRQVVFVLYEMEGYTVPEIAEIVQDSVDNLYFRLRTARKQFSAAVRRLKLRSRHGR